MAIEMKGLPRIDSNELPSQVLTRFENENSDGGTSITPGERYQLKQLYHHYLENLASLQRFSHNTIFNELKALRQIEELPEPFMFSNEGMAVGLVAGPVKTGSGNLIGFLAIPFGAIVFGLLVWGVFVLGEKTAIWEKQKMKNILDKLEVELRDLDWLKAKGKISPWEYEESRRKLIENAIRSY